MSIEIVNDGPFLRVKNTDSGVQDLISKKCVEIQKTSDKYFTIRSDNFTGYFVFDQISVPLASDMDDLISTLVSFMTTETNSSKELSSESVSFKRDMFGNLQVVNKSTRLDIKSTFGISSLRDRVTVEGDGSVENPVGNSEYKLSLSTEGLARLRTVERGRYVAGITAEIGIGMRFSNEALNGNQRLRWGYFDDDNGMYFQKDKDDLAVVIMREGIENYKTRREAWNVDKLDGSGPSGMVFDASKGNIFQIVYTWYGYGAISFRIVVANGGDQFVQTVHTFAPNGQTSVKNPNLPITAELSNSDVTDPDNMSTTDAYVTGRQYSIIGDIADTNVRITSPYALNVSVPDDGAFRSVLNLRRKTGYFGNPVRVSGVEVLTTSAVLYQVRLNAVDITENDDFQGIPDTRQPETALEQNTSITTLNNNGIVLFTGFSVSSGGGGRGGGGAGIETRAFDQVLEENDVMSVCVRSFDGDAEVSCITRFSEEW